MVGRRRYNAGLHLTLMLVLALVFMAALVGGVIWLARLLVNL